MNATTTKTIRLGLLRSRKLLAALAAFLIFAVGFAAGGSSTGQQAKIDAAADTKAQQIVAARPTPTQTVTATEEVKVEKAPASCTDALSKAEQVMDLSSQGLALAGDAIAAAGSFDTARLSDITDQITAMTPRMSEARAAYDEAATQCRAAA